MFNDEPIINKIIRLANKIAASGLDGPSSMRFAAKVIYEMERFNKELGKALEK